MVSGGLRWGVEPICSALEIAPSTYWTAKVRPPSARAIFDAVLAPPQLAVFVATYSVYGRRKLHTAALDAGLDVRRDQVARLMAALGIRGATRGPGPRHHPGRAHRGAAPDLVKRHFRAERPDALWVADFTYCSTWSKRRSTAPRAGFSDVASTGLHAHVLPQEADVTNAEAEHLALT